MNDLSNVLTFSNSSVFSISYDMKDTKEHAISASMLGSSLVNLSSLIEQSNQLLNGDDSKIELQVKAHKPGSFTVELVAWYNTGGKEVLDVLGFSGAATVGAAAVSGSVFGTLKHLRNKKIKLTEKHGNDGESIIETEDGQRIHCDSRVATLITNTDVRKSLSEVVNKPMVGKEEAVFKVKDEAGDIVSEVITDEISAFAPISSKTVTTTVTRTIEQYQVRFATVNFESISSGWKVFLPKQEKPQTIKMKDQAFINRVNAGYAAFSKDKQYIVNIEKEVTKQDAKITKTVYNLKEVLRVLGETR